MSKVCVCSDYFIMNDDGELCLQPGTMGPRQLLTFANPGTFQFSKATYPWLARVRVEVQGGGGGSAGADAAATQCIPRPGGAGGGYSMSLLDVSALGAVETVVVGVGGAGGTGNNPGDAGDPSSFGGFVSAPGGPGGSVTIASGVVTTAATGISTPNTGNGQIVTSGGTSGGAVRLSGTAGLAGAGGDAHFGYGGYPRASEGAGSPARGHGAGAGGALSYGNPFAGAKGGNGIVVVELYG